MNINDIDIFINALHNKSLKIKKSDCLEPIYPCVADNAESTPSPTNNQPELVSFKTDTEEKPSESLDNTLFNELEFTSDFSELTQYDVNSFEYDLAEPFDLKTKEIKTNVGDHSDSDRKSMKIVLEPIDLSGYVQTSQNSFLLSNETSRSEQLSASARKYEELTRRVKSPTRETISKLNLFRNLNATSHDTTSSYKSHETFDCSRLDLEANTHNEAKFYKINDLVSIMINEDCHEECNKPPVAVSHSNGLKRKVESNFYQTKLNFKIKKPPQTISTSEINSTVNKKVPPKVDVVKKVAALSSSSQLSFKSQTINSAAIKPLPLKIDFLKKDESGSSKLFFNKIFNKIKKYLFIEYFILDYKLRRRKPNISYVEPGFYFK